MSVSALADTGSDLQGSEFVFPDSSSQPQSQSDVMSVKRKDDEEYENNNKRLKKGEDKILQMTDELMSGCIQMLQNLKGNKSAGDRFEEDKDDNRQPGNEGCYVRSSDTLQKRDDITERNTNSCLLNALVSLSKVGPDIIIEMVWLEGTHGRDAVHQVLQYIKNNLKI
jgi:hypothetical protein